MSIIGGRALDVGGADACCAMHASSLEEETFEHVLAFWGGDDRSALKRRRQHMWLSDSGFPRVPPLHAAYPELYPDSD